MGGPMAGIRNVISTLLPDGQEVMGPSILLWHYPNNDIMNGSLLTVESNQFCVLKSRGAILNVYETGQYQVETPQRLLLGSLQQAFYGGQSPWQYEALYVNRAKLVLKANGAALSRELALMNYTCDVYIHVESKEDAFKLVQHMPYSGHALTTEELINYVGPVIEQAVNQLVQVTPLEQVNEKIHDLSQIVHEHTQEFLAIFGITLDLVKVLVFPGDQRMRELISLKAFGLSELDAVRYYTAMIMAEHGIISAPNMAVGAPFTMGQALPTVSIPTGMTAPNTTPTTTPSVPAPGRATVDGGKPRG
jgi:membrane protease subunit (stomatin/prohibitin family)